MPKQNIYKKLVTWKNNKNHHPLILSGLLKKNIKLFMQISGYLFLSLIIMPQKTFLKETLAHIKVLF